MESHFQSGTKVGIAGLVNHILALFESLTLALEDDHKQASQVRLYLSRFKLWAGNLGAHRGSGSRSLEYRLRDASYIRKLVISLLSDLCGSIERGIYFQSPPPRRIPNQYLGVLLTNQEVSSDTSDDSYDQVEADLADYFNDDEDSDKSEMTKTLDEVAHVISCLLRLSITLSNPSPHSRYLAREDDGLIESYVHWDAKHVREKFDNVSEQLAKRLGRAMARRRLYLKYREEHKNRLAQGLVEYEDEDEQATTVASSLPDHLKDSDETCSTWFTIADDADSNASATSYATSNPDSTQLRVPSLPREYYDGPFKCPFCQNVVSIDTRYGWKKHVFKDLRPYVCLSNVCKTPEHLYMRRRDWVMHMKRGHWRLWQCPLGCNAKYDIPESLERHIEASHKHEISSDKIQALVELSSVANAAKAKGQCPLCFDFQVVSEKQYEKHIGRHLEELALFTLPDIGEVGEDDGEGKKTDNEDESNDSGDEDHNGEDAGMMIEDQVAADKQRETEAEIQREAEEAFHRRLKDMRLAEEEAKKEVERARLEAERADMLRQAQEDAQVMAEAEERARLQAEERARLRYEAQLKAIEDQRKAQYEAFDAPHEETRRGLGSNMTAANDQRKATVEGRAKAEREAHEDYERTISGDYNDTAR
ncbi:hypothetical protein NW752_003315 [Fusarium irregulare]|nr:hypothetical protein NW752_003315 [Fusarium irregulare]